MATNFVQDGDVLTLTAPAGGVVSGGLYAIGNLVVVAIVTAAAGQPFAGRTHGVWSVPAAAGLAAGAKVALKEGALVASGTADSVDCGTLASAESGGFANLLLAN